MSGTEPKIELISYNAFIKVVMVAVTLSLLLLILVGALIYSLAGGFNRFEEQARYRSPQGYAAPAPLNTASPAAGQRVYVPAYSHIYVREGSAFRLAVTLSIRNADANSPISIESVTYYNSEGKLVRTYLAQRLEVAPLAAAEFFVPETDTEGGSGASFLVEWDAQSPVNPPLIESVMIGTNGQQGISFVCAGSVLKELVSSGPAADARRERAPGPADGH